MLWAIITWVIVGLIAGALARLALPGRDPMSIPMTILLGMGGALIGGFIGRLLFDEEYTAGIIMSVIGAIIILLIVRATRKD